MAANKSSVLVTRLVLVGILLVGIVLLFLDRSARSSAEKFKEQLEAAIPVVGGQAADGGEDAASWNQAKVQEAAGREPSKSYDHAAANKTFVEEYQWRGAFRSYTVYCYYRVAADKLLDAVSLNTELDESQL